MTIQFNVAEAKAKLSALIEAAERGEEVIIARAGVPVVRLAPVSGKPVVRRTPGILAQMGWSRHTPFEAFAPEPEDAIDAPLDGENGRT